MPNSYFSIKESYRDLAGVNRTRTPGFIPELSDEQRKNAALITRAVYHASEYKSLRNMQENSAVCEFVGLDPEELNKHNIYDVPLKLFGIKEALEKHHPPPAQTEGHQR